MNDARILSEIAEATGNDGGKASASLIMRMIHSYRSDFDQGRKYSQIWYKYSSKENPDQEVLFKLFLNLFLGSSELKEGKLDAVRSRLTEIESFFAKFIPLFNDMIQFAYNMLKGEMFLKEGSLDEAIVHLEDAAPLGKPPLMQFMHPYNYPFIKDVLARAYKSIGALDKAIAEYERLVTFDPNLESRCLIHPIYYYRLAKLYEEKGLRDKAIEKYEKFLFLWKDADPVFTEVDDAKKTLAGLRGK